jgi:hypothetical protein
LAVSGAGSKTVFGASSLLDINATDGSPWGLTIRDAAAASGEGLAAFVDDNGDVFLANSASDGTVVNNIILRGAASNNYIRFGPDTTHGFSAGPLVAGHSVVTIDGDISINGTTGAGATFGSIGGGAVVLKPANFAASSVTQLLVNASGSVSLAVAMDCGTTTTCAETVLTNPIVVKGTVSLSSGTPSTATITALPFTSTSSYVCTVTDQTAASALKVANASASSTVITGPNTVTDVIGYQCSGS